MNWLRTIATRIPRVVGSPSAFLAAIVLVVAWIIWGVTTRFDDTWLLWPSAIASVVTFLIAFSLQYTQNRDTRAMQLKLDEILRASDNARSDLMGLERLSDADLDRVEREIAELRQRQRRPSPA
jgi:low affinity Fe/Cu permease